MSSQPIAHTDDDYIRFAFWIGYIAGIFSAGCFWVIWLLWHAWHS